MSDRLSSLLASNASMRTVARATVCAYGPTRASCSLFCADPVTIVATTPMMAISTNARNNGGFTTRRVRRKSQNCTNRSTAITTSQMTTSSAMDELMSSDALETRAFSSFTSCSSAGSASSRKFAEACRRYAAPIGNPWRLFARAASTRPVYVASTGIDLREVGVLGRPRVRSHREGGRGVGDRVRVGLGRRGGWESADEERVRGVGVGEYEIRAHVLEANQLACVRAFRGDGVVEANGLEEAGDAEQQARGHRNRAVDAQAPRRAREALAQERAQS